MNGRIIFCNGAPSTGKTTLVRTIREVCPSPLWNLSLDDFIAGWGGRPSGMFDRIMKGYLESLRALLDNGIDVVAEAVIIPESKQLYRDVFDGVTQLLVATRCSLEVAQDREAARSDRPHIDLDHPWWFSVHEHEYDVEVDTSDMSTMRAGAELVVERFLQLR